MSETNKKKTLKNIFKNYYARLKSYFTRKNNSWEEPRIPAHAKTVLKEPILKDDNMINFKLGTSWIYESQKGRYYKKKNYKKGLYGDDSPRIKDLIRQKNTIRHYKATILPGMNRRANMPLYIIDRNKYKEEIAKLKKKSFALDLTKYQADLSSPNPEIRAEAIQQLVVLKRVIKDAYRMNSSQLINKYKTLEKVAKIAVGIGILNAIFSFTPIVSLSAHAHEAASTALESLKQSSKLKLQSDLAHHTIGLGKEAIGEIVESLHKALELGGEKVIHNAAKKLQEESKVSSAKEVLEELESAKERVEAIEETEKIVQKETFENFEQEEKIITIKDPRYGAKKIKGITLKSFIPLFKVTPLLLLIIASIVNPVGNAVLAIAITTEITRLGAETLAEHYEDKVEEIEVNADRLLEDIDEMIETNGRLFRREYNPMFEKAKKIKNKLNALLNNNTKVTEQNIIKEFEENQKEEEAQTMFDLMMNDAIASNHNAQFEHGLNQLRKLENYNNANIATFRKRNSKLKNLARQRQTRRNREQLRIPNVKINLSQLTKNRQPSINSLASPTITEGNVPTSPAYSAPSLSQPNNPNVNNINEEHYSI